MATRRNPWDDSRARSSPLRRQWGLFALLGVMVLCASPALAKAKAKEDYRNTREWVRLGRVWHALLDHSSGAVYSPERFRELAAEVEQSEAGIHSLDARGLLPHEVAVGLRWVLRLRYDYLKERGYNTPREGRFDTMESAEAGSLWTIEMQLSLLRPQPQAAPLEAKLQAAVRTNLVTELTFQRGLEQVRQELAQREQAIPKEEAENGAARAKLAQESLQREGALLEARSRRRLTRDRMVENLMPYLLDLTQTLPQRDAVMQ